MDTVAIIDESIFLFRRMICSSISVCETTEPYTDERTESLVAALTERPPKVEGVCDRCSGRLIQREDDRPESITVRLDAYERSTAPLIQFYKDLGLLMPIVAKGSPEEIYARTMDKLASGTLMARLSD